MGGKTKSSNAAKKNGRGNRQKKQPVPDLNTILAQAEAKLESSEFETALELYAFASETIEKQLESTTSAASDLDHTVSSFKSSSASTVESKGGAITSTSSETVPDDNNNNSVQKTLLLAKILGKMGEAKASIGDQEGARCDFEKGMDLFHSQPMVECLASGETSPKRKIETANVYEARAELHLYLAQLTEGQEALERCRAGVCDLELCLGILNRSVTKEEEKVDHKAMVASHIGNIPVLSADDLDNLLLETSRKLCSAHCSVAELYLTDMCFEPDAEAQCERSLKAALALDDPKAKPDAVQTMASFRLSQNRGAEAAQFILDSYGRMEVGCEAMADLVGLERNTGTEIDTSNIAYGDDRKDGQRRRCEEKAKELVNLDATNLLPGFEFRCQTAKLLLECASALDTSTRETGQQDTIAQRSLCIQASIQVLGSLLAENDAVVEVWYLLGCSMAALTPSNTEAAKFYWETAIDMLLNFQKELKSTATSTDDEDLTRQLEEIKGQVEEIKQKLSGLGTEGENLVSLEKGMMMDES